MQAADGVVAALFRASALTLFSKGRAEEGRAEARELGQSCAMRG